MSNISRNRMEAALFFAAACLVMVLAANYQALLVDLHLASRDKTPFQPGDGWKSVVVGSVVAAVAYAGFLVILLPMYEFMVQLLDRLGGDAVEDAPRSEDVGKSTSPPRRKRKSKRR